MSMDRDDDNLLWLVMKPVHVRGLPYNDVDVVTYSHKTCNVAVFDDEEMARRFAEGAPVIALERDALDTDDGSD